MKRLNADISPFNSPFQQRPEVFQSVRMDMTLRVTLSVIDHVVNVFIRQLVIGLQFVSVNLRSSFLRVLGSERQGHVGGRLLQPCSARASFRARFFQAVP